jgi:hypothetical protein
MVDFVAFSAAGRLDVTVNLAEIAAGLPEPSLLMAWSLFRDARPGLGRPGMTDVEWCACIEPETMWKALKWRQRTSERKHRLFAVACCRRLWPLLTDDRSRHAVEIAERFADGKAGKAQLGIARDAGRRAHQETMAVGLAGNLPALAAAFHVARSKAAQCAMDAITFCSLAVPSQTVERGHQAALLRDIFGPSPFISQPPLPPSLLQWKNGLVVKLARAAYDDRLLPSGELRPDRLGILSDALEEAGAGEDQVALCRQPRPRARGWHLLDLILQRR